MNFDSMMLLVMVSGALIVTLFFYGGQLMLRLIEIPGKALVAGDRQQTPPEPIPALTPVR